jgi:hypothetical protein
MSKLTKALSLFLTNQDNMEAKRRGPAWPNAEVIGSR